MRRPVRTRSVRRPKAERQAAPGSRRDRLAVLLTLVTVVCLGSAFFLSKDTQFLQFLMPGPLASAHGSIENCSACHTKRGSGKLSWIHGLVAGDPLADSKACLTCHKMPDTAFNAHGASAEVLEQSTERLTKLAAGTPVPQSARAQSIAFPTDDKVAHGLYCATCHQEHQGANFKLNKISNEQCRSCHVVKFDSFDGHHPEFENYPFKRRTPIIYDHAGHSGRHFPEVAKRDPARLIPATCSSCHNSRADRRIMAVAPFEQTCSGCHLDQIIGKERVSGPKGIAFLALPGLDLQTLKKKKASIGEWPDASEAEITPFMKVMISRNERGRALIKTLDSLNLQDLSGASDDQILAVTNLVWEIKGLFYALIKGKASDVLADLNIGGSAKLSAVLVADLTANIPRDVVLSAHQQWLPNLGTEMAATTEFRLAADSEPASIAKPSRLAQADQQTLTRSAPGPVAGTAVAKPQTRAAPVISIESDVDPENWAEYGGWYRQDYAIFYRPAGHKDRFVYSWLFLTGPQAPKGDTSPAAAVFDFLTSKDAQGRCTKCHSVDDIQGKGRLVNFSPLKIETKQGRFTNFIHEPHFGVLKNRGCLTCHNLDRGRPYLRSYEQGNPKNFMSNFGAVKKDLCQTCHTSSMARQDCLLCHKYHVNGVITPIMNTRIPTE